MGNPSIGSIATLPDVKYFHTASFICIELFVCLYIPK